MILLNEKNVRTNWLQMLFIKDRFWRASVSCFFQCRTRNTSSFFYHLCFTKCKIDPWLCAGLIEHKLGVEDPFPHLFKFKEQIIPHYSSQNAINPKREKSASKLYTHEVNKHKFKELYTNIFFPLTGIKEMLLFSRAL